MPVIDDDKDAVPFIQNKVIILPQFIERDTYQHVVTHLLNNLNKPVCLFCDGLGGSVDHAFAIVDMIQYHGNVTGVLLGAALSAHSTIWAGCQHRYAFPRGSIGIHSVSWSGETSLSVHHARFILETFSQSEVMSARVLAAASNKSHEWWYERMTKIASTEFENIYADELIQIHEMARPAIELDKKWLIKALQLPQSKKSASPTK